MALRDTLVRLKRQQENPASFEAENPRLKDDWVDAIRSLVDDFKTFLAPFEADGSLTVHEREVSLTEDMLGTYVVPAATVEAGSAKIDFTPVGRIVVGAIGRVDLSRQGYSKSSERILLLRLQDDDRDVKHWMLRTPVEIASAREFGGRTKQFDFQFVPFDRENVEKAIDFLLSL